MYTSEVMHDIDLAFEIEHLLVLGRGDSDFAIFAMNTISIVHISTAFTTW
jgi:hypothetical protein